MDGHAPQVSGTVNRNNQKPNMKGGLAAIDKKEEVILKLSIAGLMSDEKVDLVARKFVQINNFAKSLGCNLINPFMALSFLTLLVIPELKISNQGLFNGCAFKFVKPNL